MVPTSNITAYMIRVAVELRHESQALHAEQHIVQAALPQQAAS